MFHSESQCEGLLLRLFFVRPLVGVLSFPMGEFPGTMAHSLLHADALAGKRTEGEI